VIRCWRHDLGLHTRRNHLANQLNAERQLNCLAAVLAQTIRPFHTTVDHRPHAAVHLGTENTRHARQ